MRDSKPITEPFRKAVLDELLLTLGADETPFAFVGVEHNLSPDDWAYFFVSLNREYRDAYAELSTDGGDFPAFQTSWLIPTQLRSNKIVMVAALNRFGLVAWIDPSTAALPELNTRAVQAAT